MEALKSKPSMKKSSSINSDDSAYTTESPLRYLSPMRSDAGDPFESPPYASPELSPQKPPPDNSKALVPLPAKFTPHKPPPEKSPSPLVVYNSNRAAREDPPPSVPKVAPNGFAGDGGDGAGVGRSRPPRRDDMVKTAALGFRISELVLCLISFSVMAADKTQGWSGDSFDRYKEYRYCLAVAVIGFAYAAFQAYNLSYLLGTGKYVISHHLRRHFDFFMDQVLAYLLISASSSAATRVDDWQSNWGKDEFTEMATASVSMAFLAFVAFALSSLISGYNLCTNST
ncbi:CASP-like protein 4A3 [Argentina anserina]|uniref:CASP-like protein 4A3 n=1 Tax=Argentina anserina TaxID=57926 RepID=UPI002176635A|nr:CASP-like protein 4A3 [Potentilla anserina]